MDQRELHELSLEELRRVVASLDGSQMDTMTNCEPWTVRQLTSHAINNQLLWAGFVSRQEFVSMEDTMGAVPHDGDLVLFADDVAQQVKKIWSADGVLTEIHPTPIGELPGTVVIDNATIDAFAHAWDLSMSVGDPIEFPAEAMSEIGALVERTCTDAVRDMGLIKAPTDPPADASETERLMAHAGRTIPR